MYFCEEDDCQYDACKQCLKSEGIKDQFGHPLTLDNQTFECKFCDSEEFAVLRCANECDFTICLKCVSGYGIKYRCLMGHPIGENKDRINDKVVCNYCSKSKKNLKSCDICNFDICTDCFGDDKIKQFKLPLQTPISKKTWVGEFEIDNDDGLVELELKMEESG